MQSIRCRRVGGRIIAVIAGLIIIALALMVFWARTANTPAVLDVINSEENIILSKPEPQSLTSTILFTGNIFWGRYVDDWSMASSLKYAYPFSRLNELNRSSYDAWVSGLECPTVAGINMTSAEEDATLTFNCSPDYLAEASKWFTVFSLATNHTDNQGSEGFDETRLWLDKYGIQYFGHYDPRAIDDVCEIISIPAAIINSDNSGAKGYLPVAMCGYNGVFRLPLTDSVEVIKKYSQYMTVIAMPHMGAEYVSTPDQLKIDFYRSLIDSGADVVLGDHPHWIQSSESYKGHLIVYSMGNFMFDQQDTNEVTRSAAIKVVISANDSEQLEEWLQIGELCKIFQDACLDQIKQQKLSKLDVKYQFGVVGTDDSNKIVRPASKDIQNSILERLKWSNTVKGLQDPYGSL